MIAGLSIAAFPLTSAFVTKSMTLTAAADQHMTVVWLLLLFASAGVMEHSTLKVNYCAFLAPTKKDWSHVKSPPWNMQVSMVITAALCLGIGIFPQLLYRFLEFQVAYKPYTALHVIGQLQLLLFAAAAFCWMVRSGRFPHEQRSTNLDFDWVYRRLLPTAWHKGLGPGITAWHHAGRFLELALTTSLVRLRGSLGHGAALTRTRTVRDIALWILCALGVGLTWVYWLA
jgi:multicomponent Na+:H+ antiporter subunit D